VEKPDGKGPLRRLRFRWTDNIEMDFREIGLGGIDWINEGPATGSCEHDNEHSASLTFWEILE
jgi:hypothetical protein